MTRSIPRAIAVIGALVLLAFSASTAMGGDKVTICHAAGRDGTTKFVTLTIPAHAAAKHIDDNGTPRAGHEQDYMGACQVEATPTPDPSASPSETPDVSPSPSIDPTPVPTIDPTPDPRVPDTGLPYIVREGDHDNPFNLLAFIMIAGSMGWMIWRAKREQE